MSDLTTVPARVHYDPTLNLWYAHEGGFWNWLMLRGAIGSGDTPESAYKALLRAIKRGDTIRAKKQAVIYFDANGHRRDQSSGI